MLVVSIYHFNLFAGQKQLVAPDLSLKSIIFQETIAQ